MRDWHKTHNRKHSKHPRPHMVEGGRDRQIDRLVKALFAAQIGA